MAEQILVVDDDETTLWLVTRVLEQAGFTVLSAHTPEEGLALAKERNPHLMLLDIMMPGMDGWEVGQQLREFSNMPLIFLTARASIHDVVRGLELGADDYIVKPFDSSVLIARVRAHLRRMQSNGQGEELIVDNGDIRINLIERSVEVRGKEVELTRKEFELLVTLVRNAGRVLTRSELAAQAWGPRYADAYESLKLYVHYLRRKIERNHNKPEYIATMRGVGYRFTTKS